jgi:hypothetical protein
MPTRWEMTITAEAEVVPGPRRRIRELCQEAERTGDVGEAEMARQILAILDETEGPL